MHRETVAELVGPGERAHAERPALRSGGGDEPERSYDYDRLRTEAQKTGNFLSHQGVRDGRRVGVVAGPSPAPVVVLTLLGGALTGAVVHLDPPREFDGRAVVAPVDRVEEYDLPPGGRRIAYGGAPEDPATVHFEEEMWSENPTFPPPRIDQADPLLATREGDRSHAEVIGAAERVLERADLDRDAVVALRTSLAAPGAVAAGVVAPLLAGATVLLPGADAVGTHAVVGGSDTRRVPEAERIDPAG